MPAAPATDAPKRLVVLASGGGSTLQALLDAAKDEAYGLVVAAVGSDRPDAGALDRARASGVDVFVVELGGDRDDWNARLADAVAAYEPDLVLSAGFMRLLGDRFLARFPGRVLNSHPALLPSFPGAHGVRDALAYGVKTTGCTLFVVDSGVDSGPILAQRAVEVRDGDDESTLHERIKHEERTMLVEVMGRLAREGFTVQGRKVTIP